MTSEISRYPAVPPAIEGVSVEALDSATDGAIMLDTYAATPEGRNLLAHALVQLARDGWLRISPDPSQAWEPLDQRPQRDTPDPEDAPAATVADPRFEPLPDQHLHRDVDGDTLLVTTDRVTGHKPGVYFRTDPRGSSILLADMPAFITQVQVIAQTAKREADAREAATQQ